MDTIQTPTEPPQPSTEEVQRWRNMLPAIVELRRKTAQTLFYEIFPDQDSI